MISPIAAEFEQAIQRGDRAAALNLAQGRVESDPGDAVAWHCLGHVLDEENRSGDADAAFLRARTLAPGMIRFRFSLAGACFMRGDWLRATRHFAACVAAQPQWKDAWTNLARARLKAGDAAEAFAAASRAVALPPEDAGSLKLQAICAEMAAAPAETVLAIRERIARAAPNDPEAHFLLAMAHWASRRHGETHACLQRCLAIQPDYLTARWVAAQLPLQTQFQNDAERDAYLKQWRDGMAVIENMNFDSPAMQAHCEAIMQMHTNFYLAYLGGTFVDEQRRYGAVMQRISSRVCGDVQIQPRRITRTRRRIGVISASMLQHSVTKLFMPAFLGLDRSCFEVIGLCPRNQRDPWSDRFEAALDGYEHGNAQPRQWAQRIANLDLDVLVYLDVGMHGLASSLAALRLAPVQAVLWGHPFTTGLATMDWFLSSAAMEPHNYASHYVEKVQLLPGIGCVFDPPEFAADINMLAQLAHHDGKVHAACLQNAEKLSPRHDALFVRLLQSVPELQLSFAPGLMAEGQSRFEARLRGACAAASVDFDTRIKVYGRLSQPEFAALTASQDFILDSFDWSGGVTALETFWLDKPILTLPGALMRGRHTYAMLRQMGLDELVADDEEDYLRRAIRLASEAPWRTELTQRVAANKHRLFRDSSVRDALSAWLASVQPE
jgi:protein O-GlcNAc transferase